jgi:DNA-binding MarR family transcriptional regulator
MKKNVRQPTDQSRELYLIFQRILRCLDFGRSLRGKAPSLTATQMRVLSFFNDREVVHISDVSRTLGMSLQRINNIVSRLAARGLVRRSPNAHDRRLSDIRLTEKGTKGLMLFRQDQMQSLDDMLDRLDGDAARRLIDALHTAQGVLEQAVQAGNVPAQEMDGRDQAVD